MRSIFNFSQLLNDRRRPQGSFHILYQPQRVDSNARVNSNFSNSIGDLINFVNEGIYNNDLNNSQQTTFHNNYSYSVYDDFIEFDDFYDDNNDNIYDNIFNVGTSNINQNRRQRVNTNDNELLQSSLADSLHTLFNATIGLNRINYYENANDNFKNYIKDDSKLTKFYNQCCKILFGDDRDFVGRFTDNYVKKAHDMFKEKSEDIKKKLKKVSNGVYKFYTLIYKPTIKEMYKVYINNKKNESKEILKKYVVRNECQLSETCCICQDNIKSDYVLLECEHAMHYSCVKKWVCEKNICPMCRKIIN